MRNKEPVRSIDAKMPALMADCIGVGVGADPEDEKKLTLHLRLIDGTEIMVALPHGESKWLSNAIKDVCEALAAPSN